MTFREERKLNLGYAFKFRAELHRAGYSLYDLASRGVRVSAGRVDGNTPALIVESDKLPRGWEYSELGPIDPRPVVVRALELAGLWDAKTCDEIRFWLNY